jgi:hypothetical protein
MDVVTNEKKSFEIGTECPGFHAQTQLGETNTTNV